MAPDVKLENNGVDRDTSPYEYGFSVRCIKANLPPEIPSNPTPDNGALNQPLNISLSWSCSDPNIDSLIFDIYFGTISDPPMEVEGLTSFFYNVSNLENNTEYYWKVIVYDCHGNRVESPVWNFTSIWECGDDFADQRDGEIYNTVLIGEQCWMAECLNVGTMIDGSMDQTDNAIFEKYCYNNIEDSCSNYGGLYQWNEVMQYDITEGIQGICPSGWHIPTDEEWKILEGTVDSYFGYPDDIWNNSGWRGLDAGYHLKSMSGWDSNGNGDDLYGFNATASGYRYLGSFYNLGIRVRYWSFNFTQPIGLNKAWTRVLAYNEDKTGRYDYLMHYGFSVRCLKTSNFPPNPPSNPIPDSGAINQSINIQLIWSCVDPENDTLDFAIYLGTDPEPPFQESGISDTFYMPQNLDCSTLYYWKIIANDSDGNSTEGPVWNFTTTSTWECGCSFTDDRDGQIYQSVLIGDQCWMADNLNFGTRVNAYYSQTDNGITEKYCYWDSESWCSEYGGLYQWDEMMQYDSIPAVPVPCARWLAHPFR